MQPLGLCLLLLMTLHVLVNNFFVHSTSAETRLFLSRVIGYRVLIFCANISRQEYQQSFLRQTNRYA